LFASGLQATEFLVSWHLVSRNVKVEADETIVLCVSEAWLSILPEEHRLRLVENRVLRRTFGLKTMEVTGV
jgi:hypothetical protein